LSRILSVALGDWRAALTKLLAQGHRDGSIRRDMTTSQQGLLLMSLIQGSLVLGLADRNGESLAAVQSSLEKLLSAKYDTRRTATARAT